MWSDLSQSLFWWNVVVYSIIVLNVKNQDLFVAILVLVECCCLRERNKTLIGIACNVAILVLVECCCLQQKNRLVRLATFRVSQSLFWWNVVVYVDDLLTEIKTGDVAILVLVECCCLLRRVTFRGYLGVKVVAILVLVECCCLLFMKTPARPRAP